MIRRYLKFKLGLNYKVVKTISCNHNFIVNKLKRQCAASNYINFLYEVIGSKEHDRDLILIVPA